MRAFIAQRLATRPSGTAAWLPALPHVLVGAATWPLFGGLACVTGLLMASMVTFVVWLPLTALAMNRGQPVRDDSPGPALTRRAKVILFALWTVTVWAAAANTW